eukprot:TRINITY_DN3832_c0_g3_i2.p1 TRINITY_DN3832_c0_g3~~TRINITY_DN3832_c0_g3_i2.p1  ORF type:complete len:848 (+),score=249.92 TRINITY_DN3832_c0_g3_i2:325-2544(+)
MATVLSRILGIDSKEIKQDFEKGDMSQTCKKFFEESGNPCKNSTLTLSQVNQFLDTLTTLSKEDEQQKAFQKMLKKCTGDDLKYLWKIIDHDLKINIGPKFVLNALHPKAFDAFLKTNNLQVIIQRIIDHTIDAKEDKSKEKKGLNTEISMMHPLKPMLARPGKSMEQVMKLCPNGMFAEIKYDGERIQIHKEGDEFKCFSRNLKEMKESKVGEVVKYITKSITADTAILDGEILLMDSETKKPLPFGTLGVHKKKAFKDATVCIIVFDILYFNGETLLDVPIDKRREKMEESIKVIPGRIEISQLHDFTNREEIAGLMSKAIRDGLEGLVVKDKKGKYEPNARHWVKLKKDYLEGLADSADLLVLGANYGTGKMGGLMSVFLMGVYDKETKTYKTVTKVANGFSEDEIKALQKSLKMKKISGKEEVPDWLDVSNSLVPEFVCKDPKQTPVWEITATEFSNSNHHTANGISIRFPRVLKVRDDKDWASATTLAELIELHKTSKETSDFDHIDKGKSKKKKDEANDKKKRELEESEKEENEKPKKAKKEEDHKSDVLEGCVIMIDKSVKDLSGWKKKISNLGAELSGHWTVIGKKKCTHLVTNSKDSEDVNHVLELSSDKVVHLNWLEECMIQKKRVDEKKYLIQQEETGILPNLFSDHDIFIFQQEDKRDNLERYIIAGDGNVTNDIEEATLLIAQDWDPSFTLFKKKNPSLQIVKRSWVWKSVKKGSPQPLKSHTLQH